MGSSDVGEDRSSAADLAASALLGALVWTPSRIRDLPWLRADDFWRPTDGAVYATIVGLGAHGHRVDARTIESALRSGDYHDLQGRVRDNPAVILHSLLATTPATPSDQRRPAEARSEHIRYGQLVLEDAIRREVAAAGARIGQNTRAAVTVDHEAAAGRIEEALDAAAERLRALTERQRSSSAGALRPGLTTTLRAGEPRTVPEITARGSDESGSLRAPLRPRETRRAEHRLIGSVLSDPEARRTAVTYLRADDFSDPSAAATWATITELSRGGGPVDYVFVAAESERRAAAEQAPHGLAPALLRDLATRALPGGGDLDTVARAALERVGRRVESDLAAVAADKVRRSPELLENAHAAVDTARASARRVGSGARLEAHYGRPAPPLQRDPADTGTRHSASPTPVTPSRERIPPSQGPARRR